MRIFCALVVWACFLGTCNVSSVSNVPRGTICFLLGQFAFSSGYSRHLLGVCVNCKKRALVAHWVPGGAHWVFDVFCWVLRGCFIGRSCVFC